MADDTSFKFSRLDGGGDHGGDHGGSREAFANDPEIQTTDIVVTSGDGRVRGNVGERGADRVRQTTLLLMALVGVICLLSIVVSALALSRVMSLAPEEKVWTFAVGSTYLNFHYIDDVWDDEVSGFDVDMVRTICSVANKKCRIVMDVDSNCWLSQKGEEARGGNGLMGGWYDACVGWAQTHERRRIFAFTEPYTKPIPSVFFVNTAQKNSFDPQDMAGKRIGFLEGYADDEHCLNRQSSADIQNLPLKMAQISHFSSLDDAAAALKNNTVDAIYTTQYTVISDGVVEAANSGSYNCSTRGRSVMTRKDSGLEEWWNEAWTHTWETKYYNLMCQSLQIRHGGVDGLSPDKVCLHM
ncbi:uncharacterized protein [Diadema antillarum]|uniref:uncharacterized protein n=1 Tax=Diadema antillarum TaxID=105358 RepID=UPI003A8518DE